MYKYLGASNKSMKTNKAPQEKDIKIFIMAFERRLGRNPFEYINEKIKNGSQINDIKYLFDVISAEISIQNKCKSIDFDYFYKTDKPCKVAQNPKKEKLENSGKYWTTEEEQLLIKMYNSNATKKEMCDTFKRTENGLAARLVHLGIIDNREVFRNRN